MDHVIVRPAPDEIDQAREWARSTPDGDLLDLDIFEHSSTFLLGAARSGHCVRSAPISYLPVQQPLMLENLIFRPGLTDRERSVAITRMTEGAITEAYKRDAGELYFLCKHEETCRFAEHHLFTDIYEAHGLKTYRLNLREVFGR